MFQVNYTTCAGGLSMKNIRVKPGETKEEKYVQYVTSKPILSMPSPPDVQFDGDVYFVNDEMWDTCNSYLQHKLQANLSIH